MDNESGPGMAAFGPWLRRQPGWLKAALALVLVMVLGTAAYALSQPRVGPLGPAASGAPTAESATPTPTPTPEPPPVALNILLLGSDSRANTREEAAAGTPADQRSDVMMLIHVPADRKKIYGISIMRDTWVEIPGYGQAKINAGLELGGIPLAVKTVESLFGQHIDHTVMIDFEGFKAATDALGGVDVNVTVPFTSTHDSQHDFPAGINHLNGAEALEFVRERYAFADGDFQRIRDQQTFLKAVIAKFMSAGTLTNPATVRDVINAVRPHLTVDEGFNMETLARLAFSLRGVGPENAVLFRLPTAGFGTSTDGQSIVLQDPAAIAAIGAALAQGTLPDYVAANGLEGGN